MNRSVLILMASVALVGTNGLLLSPVLTDIAHAFGETAGVTGRAVAAYSAGTAITAVWLGRSLDRFGLSRALAFAMLLVGLSQIGSAFSTGWRSLAFAQFLAGAAAGVALPSIYGITAAISPKGQETRYMSRVIFGWSIAMVAAVPLGAFLADLLGWRMMLSIIGSVAVGAGVLNYAYLPSSGRAQNRVRMGRFTPLFLTGGMTQYATCLFFMMAFYGLYAFIGAHTRAAYGISATAAGLSALSYGIGFGIAMVFAGIVDKVGRARALPFGLAVTTVLLSSLWLAGSFPVFLGMIFIWGFINHFLLNMIVVGLNALAPNNRGAVMGLYSSITYLAAALGILLMGHLYEGFGFFAVALTAGAFNLMAMLLALRPLPK